MERSPRASRRRHRTRRFFDVCHFGLRFSAITLVLLTLAIVIIFATSVLV
jgi:hypothetical protein